MFSLFKEYRVFNAETRVKKYRAITMRGAAIKHSISVARYIKPDVTYRFSVEGKAYTLEKLSRINDNFSLWLWEAGDRTKHIDITKKVRRL